MAAPEGYVALDLIGFTDKGDYAAGTTYVKNDLVHSDNRIYLSLQDNNVGNVLPVLPATETTYWKLWLSGGSDNLDDLTAKDTSNLMGTGAGQVVVAQALIDAMASKIVQQNSDLEASGIMPPSSGNGTINEYWGTGTVAYRIVNGICILYFDITLNQITIDGADICTNIPKSKMNIYQKFLISSGNAMIYVVNGGTQLKSNKVEAGQINGFLVYPII